jgi:tripartite-type tricarboxylate transporter receptor subunit TctC
MKRAFQACTIRACSFGAIAMAALLPAASWAWEPTKPVEIIVPFSAGGASDQMARTIQGIVAKHSLMKQPLIVVNKAGASGAEGLMDVKNSPGDPNKLLVASSALYTVPLISKLPFNWRDLSPVAMVAVDEFVLWVNAKSPYDSVDEFVSAAKAKKLKMGGTSSKREDQMITAMVEHQTGAKFIYVPYKGGGEAATQLSGNHIDANVNNPSESVAQWRAGEHRALCVFAEERLSYTQKVTDTQSWHDVPTCKEKGLDVHYEMLRIFLLPGKATPEQVAYYADVFKKINDTPEWQQYLQRSALKPEFLTGAPLTQYLEKDEAMHKDIIKSAGFAD